MLHFKIYFSDDFDLITLRIGLLLYMAILLESISTETKGLVHLDKGTVLISQQQVNGLTRFIFTQNTV